MIEDDLCLSAMRGRSIRLFLEAGRIDENGLTSASEPEDRDDALDNGGDCPAL
jgi:hypothetical protein